jgi:hypothetical protein
MDDIDKVEKDAVITDPPSAQEEPEPQKPEPEEPEKELTDDELKEEIARLDEEIKKEEDAVEKRHKEQDKGWKMKIVKERDKAKALEEDNRKKEESIKSFEKTLIEEAYSKTIDENFWLPYFENLTRSNPDLANKIAKEKWGKKDAKHLILDTKRQLAASWDEELKKVVSEEDIRTAEREKVYHELALDQVKDTFDDLSDEEKTEADEYFQDIIEGKKLTPTTAKKYAEMAKLFVTKNRKADSPKIDKEKVLADKASISITPKSSTKQDNNIDVKAVRQQLLNAGVTEYQVNLMYPLK